MDCCDSPAEIGDHTVVMAAEYVGVCFSLIAICKPGYDVKNGVIKGFPVTCVQGGDDKTKLRMLMRYDNQADYSQIHRKERNRN